MTLPIDIQIKNAVPELAEALFGQRPDAGHIQIQKTRKEFEGDFTLVVFPLVKMARKSPEQTASILGEALQNHLNSIVGFNVVKGFLNLVVSPAYWSQFLKELESTPDFGFAKEGSKGSMMVEFASPNTNKPLHLGHMRNIFLGNAVANILKANGHTVYKVQIINDRGIHICKSMLAWKRYGNGETPEGSGKKGDKLVGDYYVTFDKKYREQVAELVAHGHTEEEAKKQAEILLDAQEMLRSWEKKDPEVYSLWETMNAWVYAGFDATYREMQITFDKVYYESDTYLKGKEEVMRGLENGVFYRKDDGSIWVDLTDNGMDEKLLLRGDGTAVYMTQDIGTAILRFEEFPDLEGQIYTVGNEQEYHFQVLFILLEKLGFSKAKNNYHLSYGMVELPEGKMKSREGKVVEADELLEEMVSSARAISEEQGKLESIEAEEKERLYKIIGYGAVKYFLLKVDPRKKMLFDPKESIDFIGNTGPFIQFNYVRTLALHRKAQEEGVKVDWDTEIHPGEPELNVLRKIHDFPSVIREAANAYDPSLVANYTYELVKEYSSFYQSSPILKEENAGLRAFRLELTRQTGQIVRRGMELLGIEMPERM